METPFARSIPADLARRHTWRVRAVSLVAPATVAAGLVWAILQPYRLTLLHPRGESFWWLAIEPPLLVVLAGIVFAFLVAPSVIEDLESYEDGG